MEQYISKSALIAEIEKRIKTNKECMLGLRNLNYYQGKAVALYDTISLLNTLEVKEVDFEKELSEVWRNWANEYEIAFVSYKRIARHFFELGVRLNKNEEKS